MNRFYVLVISVLLFSGCSKDGEYSSSIARLGLNFSAKSMCSCLWVSENDEEFCREYTALKQVTPKISVDHEAKTVTTSLFWILSAKANFLSAHKGCQLGVKD